MKKILILSFLFYITLIFSQKNENYYKVSFSSICCGTPSQKPVSDFINSFQKKNKLKQLEVISKHGLGKEGEFAIYIGIDRLSKKQKLSFINGLNKVTQNQNKVRNENHDGFVNFDSKEIVKKEDLKKINQIIINR